MKAKLNFKSKRTIIIASIIAVLAVGAGIGGYFYAKGNNQSGAANIDNETSQTSSQNDGNSKPSSDNKKDDKTPDTNQDNGNVNNNEANNGNNNGNVANNGRTDNENNANNGGNGNGETDNATNNGNATDNGAQDAGEDTDATTVIETETDINPWESHSVKWTPETLNVSTASVDVNIPKLDTEKIAYVQGEDLEGTPVNTATQKGEDITFVIKVKNTGNIDASKVMIYDTIPEGTTLKENAEGTIQTIKNADGKEIQRIVWEKDVKAGETVSVSFVVTVNAEEDEEIKSIDVIENEAKVNKEKTPKTQNPVITSKKVASLVEGEKVTELTNDDFVKPGQMVRYTISAKNNSKVDGITKIIDTVPDGTTLIEESLDKNVVKTEKEENGKKVITLEWKNVSVKAKKTTSVSFDVTVNEDAPATIRNAATVGETTPPPTENDVYIDIDITKTWDDANNQDGKRPDTITVALNKTVGENTTTIKEVDVTANDGWRYTFKDLPKFEGETEIKYTITENAVRDYETTIEGFSIINKHIPEKTEATVLKVWDDKDNQDGKRPDSITVKLSNGTEVTLNEENEWTATITDLDKYVDGKEIEYIWEEKEVPEEYKLTGNTAEGTITTITNTHVPETTEATIKKVWEDANNQDGKRPASIDVTLSNGTTITLSEDNKWTSTIKDLPKYDKGQVITYTWEEKEVPTGYELTGNTADGTITTITNTHTPELTDVTVKKVWDDADNQDGKRPASLEVTLSNGDKVTLNEGNGWTATIKNLPVYNGGRKINYSWTEESMPDGYSLTNKDTQGYITTLTNSYTPETTEASVKKVWEDNNDQDGKRPQSLTVTLSNGTDVTLNEANGWTATVAGLAKFANGQEIEYTWSEGDAPQGYTLTSTNKTGTLTTLTNTHTPETTEASVKKIWDDAEDQDGIRPTSLVVTLSNGATVTLNEANGWTEKVENLPKFANGQEIEYTWSEGDAPQGYTLTSTNKTGTLTTLTNTHTPETTEASVKKIWDDNNDQDGKRPEELIVTLSNGSTVTLNETNNWEAKITGLPKNNAGKEIEYTWTEATLTDYELTSTNKEGTLTTITNTLLKSDVSVTKKQYMYNSETEKYEEVPNGTVVRAGDEVVYLLTATNDGNKEGKTVIRDPKPDNAINIAAWIDSNENCIEDRGETTVDLAKLNGEGTDPITVPANSKVVIAYKVRVDGYANEEVRNTAYYKNEGEDEKPTDEVFVKIEDDLKVVPTTSEGGERITNEVVLILDYSSSMNNNNKLNDLKDALKGTASKKGFLEGYFGGKGSTGNGNKLHIITYNQNVSDAVLVQSYNEAVNIIDSTQPAQWTNTLGALNKAKSISNTDKNISVILMTDGEPTVDEDGNTDSYGSELINDQTIAVAKTITNHGNPLHLIGFEISSSNNEESQMNITDFVTRMKDDVGAHYYSADSATELANAFKVIETEVTNTDGDSFMVTTQNGIATIDHGFTKKQDVELFFGNYAQGNTPNKVFTWDEFFATEYATYNEADNKIAFNLGKYMDDEGLDTDEQVTIRFVKEGTAGSILKKKRKAKITFPASDPIPTLKKTFAEEKEDDKKVEKKNKVENKKAEDIKEVEKTEKENVEEKVEKAEKENIEEKVEKEDKENKKAEKAEKEVVEDHKESVSDKEETEKEKVEEKEKSEKEDNKEKEDKEKKEIKEEKTEKAEENEKTETTLTKSSPKEQEKTEKVEQEIVKTETTEENNN